MMSNYGILKDLEMYLAEIVESDIQNAEELGGDLNEYENGWHEGFNNAIEQVAIILDKYPQN